MGGGEEPCKHVSLACVGSARSVWATLGLPPAHTCVLSWSTLLWLQVALQGICLKRALGCVHFPGLSCSGSGSCVLRKGSDLVGSAFCALPRSEQLGWLDAWWDHSPQVGGASHHLPSPSCCSPGAPREHHLRCAVSLLGSWSQAATLLAEVNHPGSQADLVSNWEPAHSLMEDAGSGAKIAPCLLALAVTYLLLCLWWGKWPVCSWLALFWYSLSPLFCEQTRLCLRIFHGKVLSLSLWLSHSLGCYLTCYLNLSSGHSDPSLP